MPNSPITVAALLQLPSDSWVNDGFIATVRSIERKVSTKTNKPFWKCKLGDATGGDEIGATLFVAPKFSEGQSVEFSGQGVKFKNGQYGPEVNIGDKTTITILGTSVHHEEQQQRKADCEPPVSGKGSFPIAGQTVGMAMKEALALAGMAAGGVTRATLKDPLFWADVKTYAGNIIRISRSLEAGKLSPPSWPVAEQREEAPTDRSPAPAAKSATKPQPGADGAAFPADAGDESEIPF